MALALENPDRIVLLDDMLARRTAQVAGLQVWGTLKVLLEAKSQGLIEKIEPFVSRLSEAGMWISAEVKQRILILGVLRSKACQQSVHLTLGILRHPSIFSAVEFFLHPKRIAPMAHTQVTQIVGPPITSNISRKK